MNNAHTRTHTYKNPSKSSMPQQEEVGEIRQFFTILQYSPHCHQCTWPNDALHSSTEKVTSWYSKTSTSHITSLLFPKWWLRRWEFVTYSYADACRNIQHNKDERTQFFRKIYLSLYSKGLRKVLCVRDELKTEQNCNIMTPPTLLAITAFLSRSPELLNRGPGGPASAGTWFSFQHLLSNWLTSCRTRVI